MGQTPTYGFPYPEPEDEPDGPVQIEALADAVETSLKNHADDTTSVHGIPDTSVLATDADIAGLATQASVTTVQSNLTAHANDTTAVHGIPDTAVLVTDADLAGYATDAELSNHAADTTNVHGIVDTSQLLTQANIDELATKDELADHEADTTAVHGIADTSALVTDADLAGLATDAELAAHAADTTSVHGIADTSVLATDADVATVQGNLTTHAADTTDVHGIADTSALLTSADLSEYATDAELAAHASDTTAVHGIADTSVLETQTGAQTKATAAQTAAESTAATALSGHAADTTAVHGIADTSALLTDADLADYATDAELAAHTAATTSVHGIPDTSALVTDSDLAGYATDAELTAHAADTTAVHGIADTAVLETQAGAQSKVDTHSADTTSVHGIADTSALLTDADLADYATDADLAAHAADTTSVHGIADTSALETISGAASKFATITDLGETNDNVTDLGGSVTNLDGFVQDCLTRVAAIENGTAFLAGVNSTGPVSITDDLTVTGAVNAQGVVDWLNVRKAPYNATGDGTTDDRAAIQAAIDACPEGGVVYLPNGDYRLGSSLFPKPGVTLMMPHSNMMLVAGITDPTCRLRPLPAFTGEAVLIFRDQTAGGYATIPAEHRLINIMIDGSAYVAGNLDGIVAKGNIQNVVMEGVTIRQMSNNGIYTGDEGGIYPYSWRMTKVMIDNCHANGAIFNVMTDLTMIECQVIGSWGHGLMLNNLANGQLIGCRVEWSGNHGYYITGNWGNGTGSGGLLMAGCSTDRNGYNGVFIDATGTPPIVISNLMTRRDGRNGGTGGGGYAGVKITNATLPVTIGDWINFPGVDDNGTSTSSPDWGGSFTGTNACIQVDNAYLHAAVGGLEDGGANTILQLGANLTYATGPTTAPVRTAQQTFAKPSGVRTAGIYYVASAGATARQKGLADYICDGTADNVEIQAAITAAQADGGGIVQLSPGGFTLAAPVTVDGTLSENDPKTITLRGCGTQVTELTAAANTNAIEISDWAQINLSDVGIFISGSGIGIKSIGVNNAGNTNNVSFWHSSFRNLRINGGFVATDTVWAMELGMPWRSVFENIEIEGCRNGIKIINNATMQNAGDCVFSRFFVEIVGTGGYALYVDSIDGNMNQNTWVDFEAGANSTGCTGIWLGGTAGTASQRFIGNLNLEQFATLINVANGNSNEFHCNYVTGDTGQAGNKGFVTGSNSYNNVFQSRFYNIAAGDTVQVIEDLNTTSNCPNIFEKIRFENNTGSTVTYTKSSSTVFRDITTFNTGNAMPVGLLQYPLSVVNDPTFDPSDHGLITWTHDPATLRSTSNATTSGTVYLMKVKIVNRSTVVSNIHVGIETAGATLTAGQNFVGLYNSSGTRLALSADQAAAWVTSGAKTIALTAPQTLAVGTYYVAILAVGTTPPTFSMGAGGTLSINVGLTTATARFLTGPTAQTSLPSSITLGSQTPTSGARWAALS